MIFLVANFHVKICHMMYQKDQSTESLVPIGVLNGGVR